MQTFIVETNNLCKKYKGINVVNQVNMRVKEGDIYGFIGPNGAGESTTLKLLCRLIRATDGDVKLFGETSITTYQTRRIGAFIESVGNYSNLSAYNNMKLKATGLGVVDKTEIKRLLTLVGLDSVGNKVVSKFSLGMKQRLGIAMALLGNPDLLILDEPINGLDPQGIREMRDILMYLNEEEGKTIIISSHILGELSKIATSYGIIKDGCLIEQITHKELTAKCKSYISITVDDVQKATTILEQELKIDAYEVQNDSTIWIFDDKNPSDISKAFATNGEYISQIFYQKQDLESYFLEKMGVSANA